MGLEIINPHLVVAAPAQEAAGVHLLIGVKVPKKVQSHLHGLHLDHHQDLKETVHHHQRVSHNLHYVPLPLKNPQDPLET